jgi:4-hydroxy-tetrahydrodipicolinate synthase
MSAPELAGVLPVLATPFTADLDLDLESLGKLTQWQVDAGAGGVAVFGFASEGFALSGPERARIIGVVREILPPALPLIAGVSATGTAEAVVLADEAARGGATHLMVLPPHMVTPSRNQLAGFYRDVAAVGLPVMIQDAPGNSRVTMPPDLIVELAEIKGVTSVKVESPPTAPKIANLATAVPAGFDVLGGQNALFLLEEMGGGSVGTMPACEFTDLLVEAVAAFRAGQAALARARFNRLLPLIRFGLQPGLAWAVHKEVLVRRGLIGCAAVRPPAQPVDDRTRGWLDDVLADLGLTPEKG